MRKLCLISLACIAALVLLACTPMNDTRAESASIPYADGLR